VRPLAQGDAVIFGAEEIGSVIDSDTGLTCWSSMKLTHLYHMQVNREMREMIKAVYLPPFAEGHAKLYQVLWLEGLAVVSEQDASTRQPPTSRLCLSDTVAEEVARDWPACWPV